MDEITLTRDSGVFVVSINRPERKNAITPEMYGYLADLLAKADADRECRVLLIHGSETVFTAGSDLANLKNGEVADQDSPVSTCSRQIAAFSKPMIAAICGPAAGIGSTMLLHCELVYAGDNTRLVFPFVDLGIVPEAASTLLMPRLMGHQRAAEALMLTEPLDAETAARFGLVNAVLPPSEVLPFALEKARKLAAKPIRSLIETKRLMKAEYSQQTFARMVAEEEILTRLQLEPAAREAFNAFYEKRKPDFSKFQ